MMLPYFANKGKDPFPRKKSDIPLHKIKSDASWGGIAEFENIEFIGFLSENTWCGLN